MAAMCLATFINNCHALTKDYREEMFDISDLTSDFHQHDDQESPEEEEDDLPDRQGRNPIFDISDLISSTDQHVSKRDSDFIDEDEEDYILPNASKRDDGGEFNLAELVDWSSFSNINVDAADNTEEEDEDNIPGEHLNPSDFLAADEVRDEINYDDIEEDPILKANLFEGDIANVNLDAIQNSVQGKSGRNAIRDSWRKWPGGVIPYVISGRFNSRERAIIAKAMANYHKETCLRFVPRTNERGYIDIMQGSGCSSSVGRTGRRQQVSLGNGCVYTGIVMHELMHASGFWHEQSRADRDEHITINWHNIQSGMEYNFLKYDLNKIDHLGAGYDTCSVMHYGSTAFAKV